MTPQQANRLVLGYILASFAALLLTILLAALLGLVEGIIYAFQNIPTERLADELGAWVQSISQDLYRLANAILVGAFAYWLYTRYVKVLAPEIGWRKAPVPEILEAMSLLAFFKLGYAYFSPQIFPDFYFEGLSKNFAANTSWGWAALFFFMVILAPIVEEWLFRGLLLQSYARRRGTRFALYAQTAIFALVHGDPVLILDGLFVGWILGRMVLAGASLKTTSWAHVTFNAFAFLSLMLATDQPAAPHPKRPTEALLGFGIMLFVLFVVAKRWRYTEQPPVESGPVMSGSLAVALLIGSLSALANLFPP